MQTPGERYVGAIEAVGLTRTTAAVLFDASQRTSIRWAKDGAPPMIMVLLALLAAGGTSVEQITKLKAQEKSR